MNDACNAPATAQQHPVRTFLAVLSRHAVDWMEDRRYRAEHRDFIDELESAGDLGSFLEAVGATRDELRAWSISPMASAALLDRMIERVGLTQAEVHADSALLEDLRRACRCCATWQQCRRWLRTGLPEGAEREFCPNAGVLQRLRVQDAPS